MKKQRNDFNSKYFKLKQFDFTEEQVKEAIEDLERFLRIFKKSLISLYKQEKTQ